MWPFGPRKVACAQCGRNMDRSIRGITRAQVRQGLRGGMLLQTELPLPAAVARVMEGFASGALALRCKGCGSYFCGPCIVGIPLTDGLGPYAMLTFQVALNDGGICPTCREQQVGFAMMQQ